MRSVAPPTRQRTTLSGLRQAKADTFLQFIRNKGGTITLGPTSYQFLHSYGFTRSEANRAVDDLLQLGLVRITTQTYGAPEVSIRGERP